MLAPVAPETSSRAAVVSFRSAVRSRSIGYGSELNSLTRPSRSETSPSIIGESWYRRTSGIATSVSSLASQHQGMPCDSKARVHLDRGEMDTAHGLEAALLKPLVHLLSAHVGLSLGIGCPQIILASRLVCSKGVLMRPFTPLEPYADSARDCSAHDRAEDRRPELVAHGGSITSVVVGRRVILAATAEGFLRIKELSTTIPLSGRPRLKIDAAIVGGSLL